MKRRAKLEVWRGLATPVSELTWFAHLRAPNGEIVAVSEGYTRKAGAIGWCERLKGWIKGAKIEVQA